MTSKQIQDPSTPISIEQVLSPESIAIVGVSTKKGAPGQRILNYMNDFAYSGEIYLVSKNNEQINGIECFKSIEELPENIDCVILCIPQQAALESVEACARRKANSVVIFAAGFAEESDTGKKTQQKIVDVARENNMIVVGPNCMGLSNFVDNVPLTFAPGLKKTEVTGPPALGIIAQSGGMMSNLREISQSRGIPISYAISTGNEALTGIEDFLAYLIEDELTKVITMFAEQIKRPQLFLELAGKAREKEKAIVLLHPGRSDASKEAAQSHTGSLVGDYQIIKTKLEEKSVIMVETIEELTDVSWFLTAFDNVSEQGTAIVTDSGALKGFSLDFCNDVKLDLPSVESDTYRAIEEIMPDFSSVSNPLDITAQALTDMDLYTKPAQKLLHDSKVGSLLFMVLPGSPEIGLAKGEAVIQAVQQSSKPVAFVMVGEGSPISDALVKKMRENGIPFFRTPERAMRALSQVSNYGKKIRQWKQRSPNEQYLLNVDVKESAKNEFEGKRFLKKAGISVPLGALAQDLEEALTIAEDISYPVVLKAQSKRLKHKSDIGAVIINIDNNQQLQEAWERLHENVEKAHPDLILDGVLIEEMSDQGIEMVIGAQRDNDWGPVVMVGLGGIWIEVLKDIRFISPFLDKEEIIEELFKLRSFELLQGARGTKPADINALADVILKIGGIMLNYKDLNEVDINPLMVYPEGVKALDALFVTQE
ncbi:acetate--CoA ligase family protein [Salibacterium aidingense]|uniref:acetate--CoA ligase family protein n=1 Tax=Salibacterium aidingense TaxID=384933 RepID=UPI003BD00387